MLLTAISLIETTLNSHYLKHTKQLHPTAQFWSGQTLQGTNYGDNMTDTSNCYNYCFNSPNNDHY